MYNIRATKQVNIISTTRIIAHVSPLEMLPVSGFNKAKNIITVRTTTIWAMVLFESLIPLVKRSRIIPAKTGINAVKDGSDEAKYPHRPITINVRALINVIR
jgi:hypothetical protein